MRGGESILPWLSLRSQILDCLQGGSDRDPLRKADLLSEELVIGGDVGRGIPGTIVPRDTGQREFAVSVGKKEPGEKNLVRDALDGAAAQRKAMRRLNDIPGRQCVGTGSHAGGNTAAGVEVLIVPDEMHIFEDPKRRDWKDDVGNAQRGDDMGLIYKAICLRGRRVSGWTYLSLCWLSPSRHDRPV
jgi:hypothetical protein